ncbi:MAG: tetratricopeptide repeat protein [Candidatus Kapaibacteriales bacterium]
MRSIIITILALFPIVSLAITSFEKGNEAYKSENFGEAVLAYEEAISESGGTAEEYYNLGNAHFRMGSLGYAILSYERALKLDPSNEDIGYNLDIANARTIDDFSLLENDFFRGWVRILLNLFSPDGWAYISIAFLWVSIGILSLIVLGKSRGARRSGLLGGSALLVLSVAITILAWQTQKSHLSNNEGIVLSDVSYAYSEPDNGSAQLFVVHEGTKAEIISVEEGYFKIKLPDGNVGWISQSDMEAI